LGPVKSVSRASPEAPVISGADEPLWRRTGYKDAVARGLAIVGVERLVLAVHDASFPAGDDDLGRGTPYSAAGHAFVRFVRALGFTGMQLGPQGLTASHSPSPYEAALFAANHMSLAFGDLLPPDELRRLRAGLPAEAAVSAEHSAARDRVTRALRWLHRERGQTLARAAGEWARKQGSWLMRDATFEALAAQHGTESWRSWPRSQDRNLYRPRIHTRAGRRPAEVRRRQRLAVEHFILGQYLCDLQHADLRRLARELGLELYGDLQVGISNRDAWSYSSLLIENYLLGAPPSRTNPAGQPWGYPVLDPDQYETGVQAFVRARMTRMLDRYDSLRIDHPHGLVTPWVYRADRDDSFVAVRQGARLFDSPDLPEHPTLGRWAIARTDQLQRDRDGWDDDWVGDLDAQQVTRYGRLLDVIATSMEERGRMPSALACEVLSTCPHPLNRVMEHYGLGRFRVTQKANMEDPRDVYRSENVRPGDWITAGTHDTPPLWRVIAGWWGTTAVERRATYLAARLVPEADQRRDFTSWLASRPENLATAMFAELLASPARNVSVFFADLLGYTEIYNRPGQESPANWALRVAPDYPERYEQRRARGQALDLPRSLAMAIRAHPAQARRHPDLLRQLDRLSPPPAGTSGTLPDADSSIACSSS
jgi:4-alpha-glucanotransferase